MNCNETGHDYKPLHGPYNKAIFAKEGFSKWYSQALPFDIYYTMVCSKCGHAMEIKIKEWVNQDEPVR